MKDKEYEFHPFANVFPMMTDQEHAELVADIKTHGQREPITLFQGKIIDGRNRDRACRELGIKPLYVDFEGNDAEALNLVVSANVVRRHLTTSQRAMIADDLAALRQGQRKSDASNDASQVETAKQMHVSRPSVQRARKVKQQGTPELAAAVRQGKTTVSAAVKQIDAKAHRAAATNGHVDPGVATDRKEGASGSHDADSSHTVAADDDLPVTDIDEEEEENGVVDEIDDLDDKPARHVVIGLGEAKPPQSFAFELKDGSRAKYVPEPQTIGVALQILMHVKTVDEWRVAVPDDSLRQLVDLGAHVKMLVGEVGSTRKPKAKAATAKPKVKPKAKPKSKRNTRGGG